MNICYFPLQRLLLSQIIFDPYGFYISFYDFVIPACFLRESPAENEEIPAFAGDRRKSQR